MDAVTTRKRVPPEEQETSISITPMDDKAVVYSCVPATVHRFYKWAKEYPDQMEIESDDGYGVVCLMPLDWIKYQPRKKRTYTEEQRKEMAERLALSRRKRNDEAGYD